MLLLFSIFLFFTRFFRPPTFFAYAKRDEIHNIFSTCESKLDLFSGRGKHCFVLFIHVHGLPFSNTHNFLSRGYNGFRFCHPALEKTSPTRLEMQF